MFSPFSERDARKMLAVFVLGSGVCLAFVPAVLYLLFGVERDETLGLLLAVALCYPGFRLLSAAGDARKNLTFSLGLGLRIAAVFAFPLLSDDIYRFLWDGGLWWSGLHPFAATPEALAASSEGAAFAKTHGDWLANMNSAGYFTVYPPLSQLVFAIGGLAPNAFWGSVLVKAVLLGGELGVWWLLSRLTARLENPREIVNWYWLNPLVIVEVMGNAHFEGLALAGVLAALYALRRAGLGWARQGYVRAYFDHQNIYGPKYGANMSVRVGPGLRPAGVAVVPIPGSRRWWRWILLAAAALAAATIVKLVPLLLAPAFALVVLWSWTHWPRYDNLYYNFLGKRWKATVRAMAGTPTNRALIMIPPVRAERRSATKPPPRQIRVPDAHPEDTTSHTTSPTSNHTASHTTSHTTEPATVDQTDPQTTEDEYILSGEWPYGHPYEVVPPSPAELEALREEVSRRRAGSGTATDQRCTAAPAPPPPPPPPTVADELAAHGASFPESTPPPETGAREAAKQSSIDGGFRRVAFPLLQGHRRWNWTSGIGFGASLVALVALAMTVTLIGSGVSGFGESLDLYFRSFEFNGSLYAVASALGVWYKGFNWIAVVGPGLGLAAGAGILAISVYRSWHGLDFVTTLLWCMTVYLACATTVHPWYFLYLLGLGVLTAYRWPVLLSFTAFLSYAAYATTEVVVPTWALWLEYGPVVVYALAETVAYSGRPRGPLLRLSRSIAGWR